jgi:cold shock CspA family protein
MMQTGTAKRFNDAKRFGFITPDGAGEDLLPQFSEAKAAASNRCTKIRK